ncbi:MAG: hypothetical protein EON47_04970, partial [Acetobacteraceae bacterium]
GGTWMAASRGGAVATVLNRPGSLGPAPGLRSRGELPLLALAAGSAAAGAAAIAGLPAAEWRPFNMVLADAAGAWFLRGTGQGRPAALPLGPGVHMVTAHDPNDLASPRTARHLPRFRAAAEPRPEQEDWQGWEALLADSGFDTGAAEALRVPPTNGFGTVSSSLLAIGRDGQVIWRFATGPAGEAPFLPVAMP